jgi:hypothetical protein
MNVIGYNARQSKNTLLEPIGGYPIRPIDVLLAFMLILVTAIYLAATRVLFTLTPRIALI